MKVKGESEVAQSCPTLRDTMDCSLPGSSIHGIFQARLLEWGAIAFSTTLSNSLQRISTYTSRYHLKLIIQHTMVELLLSAMHCKFYDE